MIWTSDLTTEVINSKLADTAPALVGVVVILAPVFWFVYRMSLRQERVMDRQADAVGKLADAVSAMKDEDEQKLERHYDVLHTLAVQCNTSHASHEATLATILQSTHRVEGLLLSKAKGA